VGSRCHRECCLRHYAPHYGFLLPLTSVPTCTALSSRQLGLVWSERCVFSQWLSRTALGEYFYRDPVLVLEGPGVGRMLLCSVPTAIPWDVVSSCHDCCRRWWMPTRPDLPVLSFTLMLGSAKRCTNLRYTHRYQNACRTTARGRATPMSYPSARGRKTERSRSASP
jgi:hypothetical protein